MTFFAMVVVKLLGRSPNPFKAPATSGRESTNALVPELLDRKSFETSLPSVSSQPNNDFFPLEEIDDADEI